MTKTIYEDFASEDVTDEILIEAKNLFDHHYGVWSAQNSGKENQPIKLGKKRLRNDYLPPDISTFVRVSVDGHLAGHAFACRWVADGKNICWVTQLVVHRDYRYRGLATGLLTHIRRDHDDIFGIMSSHPAALLAAMNAFGDGPINAISLEFIRENAEMVLEASPVPYVRDAKLRGTVFNPNDTSELVSSVDTSFYIKHEEPLKALRLVQQKMNWPFGELIDGHEFFLMVPAKRRTHSG